MQRVTYRKTLDVTSGGVQFLLQGFETADRVSRRIDISLMSDGDTYDIPSGNVTALMYVRQPDSETTELHECEIKNNRIIYDARPITNEGIALMQLELVRTDAHNNVSVLVAPKFEVEVLKSEIDGTAIENEVDVSVIEKAIGKAENAYNSRLLKIEIDEDCIFRAEYEGNVTYTTDLLRRLFLNGEAELSKSYAEGDTGIRVGENADNAKYYSNVAKSEALNAKSIMSESKDVLDEVRLHGAYTAFSVNFDTGEAEYLNPAFTFNIDEETGELNAECKDTMFDGEIASYIDIWLEKNGFKLKEMQDLTSQNTNDIKKNKSDISTLNASNEEVNERLDSLETKTLPIERGGTGATTKGEALANLGGAPLEYVNQKVYVGQYVGIGIRDGQTTKDVSVRIHYDKIPKMIIIQGDTDPANSNFAIYENNAIMIYGSNKVSLFPSIASSTAGIEMLTCAWTENSVTFYNEKRFSQLNNANTTYRYVIFY